MKRARVKGALVGIESVTAEGLKAVLQGLQQRRETTSSRSCATFVKNDVHVLGSFIFGLPTDRPETFAATAALAQEAGIAFAQFVTLTPFPGTVDFQGWEKSIDEQRAERRRDSPESLLAHPEKSAAQALSSSPGDDPPGDSRSHARRVDPFLSPARGLEALVLHDEASRPPGLRADLEALPPDVRQYRSRHRQRAKSSPAMGPVDREALPPGVHRAAHARARGAARDCLRSPGVSSEGPRRGEAIAAERRPRVAGIRSLSRDSCERASPIGSRSWSREPRSSRASSERRPWLRN